MRKLAWSATLCAAVLWTACAAARGVTPYLPLDLDPSIESQIERVMVLADAPILTRPIPAAAVLDALPRACEVDPQICAPVKRFLARYMRTFGVAHLSIAGAATEDSTKTVANRHGLPADSSWDASAALYWQPTDYLIVNLGAVGYAGDIRPTGSFVSAGFDFAQLDVGFRDHWLSPFTDSSMLISTQAPTMPSVTLSNYRPFTRFGLRYQFFTGRLSSSDLIEFGDGLTAGRPRIAGAHLSIEPATGWSLGVNRLLQFGGGERGGTSFKEILRAFFRPSRFDNSNTDVERASEFGNQVASITSRFIFPGSTPFSVYLEYGGEDTSRGRNYLLGNSALSAGIEFPRLWKRWTLTYEASEWQNAWYVNSIYGDGLTNHGHVLGHWGGDERVFGDGVGAQSHMVKVGWHPSFGGDFELQYRTLANESYSAYDYERAHDVTLRYTRPFGAVDIGGEAFAGKDVFGDNFSRVGLFVRLADIQRRASQEFDDDQPTPAREGGADLFVDVGINMSDVTVDVAREAPRTKSGVNGSGHLGLGARRAVSARSDLGVRLELDDIDGHSLLGFRAIDYRYRFDGPLAAGFFLGAARYDLATPAYGIYGGVGAQWRDLFKGWDLGLDFRYATKVARDRLLASDPPGARPDLFYDITSATLYVSRRF